MMDKLSYAIRGALGLESLDISIFDNAIERCREPQSLLPLQEHGKLHIIVPYDKAIWKYDADDIRQRAYSRRSWCLGNVARFDVLSCPCAQWPSVGCVMGRRALNLRAGVWGRLDGRRLQIEALAAKPAPGSSQVQ